MSRIRLALAVMAFFLMPGANSLADPRSRSALRESDLPRQFGRLEPLPLGQGHA